jgi:hypothetical protein
VYLGNPQMYPVSSEQRDQVWAWAQASHILIEYSGTDFGLDIWLVVEPRHCLLFELRWSEYDK